MDALDAWWPPTFTPLVFGRPALAASTIAVESHRTRWAIWANVSSSTLPAAGERDAEPCALASEVTVIFSTSPSSKL